MKKKKSWRYIEQLPLELKLDLNGITVYDEAEYS